MRQLEILLLCIGIATITVTVSAQSADQKAQTQTAAAQPAAKPAETKAQPATTAAKPAETKAQPATTTVAKPAETKAQPATTAAKPAETKAQPATTAAKPAETKAQPAATTAAKPAETKAQPATTAAKPTETKAQPATTTAVKPAETKAQPTTTAAKPAETKAQPATTTAAKPAETKAQPTTTAAKPAETKTLTASEAIQATEAGQLAAAQKAEDEKLKAQKQLEKEKAEIEALIAEEKAAKERLAKEKAELDAMKPVPEVKESVDAGSSVEPVQTDTASQNTGTEEIAKAEEPVKKPLFGYKSNKPLPYLVLVSNNHIPKDIFADYLLKEFDIPHLLLPPNGVAPVAGEPVYFIGGDDKNRSIIQITADQLSDFIAFLRPQTVIILGDLSYIHPGYRMAVPENIKLIEMSNSLWRVNAVSLDNMLNTTKMFNHFNQYLNEKEAARKEQAKREKENASAK